MSMPTVTTIPNEILFCIVENVEGRDIQSMIFTCKTIEKKLLDSHVGALRLNKRFSEFLDSHISTPQVIEKHHIRSFLPFIYGAVIYYKDCNILPIFKSAIQILDSIGMKEMIIPAALFMGSSKAHHLSRWTSEYTSPNHRPHLGGIRSSPNGLGSRVGAYCASDDVVLQHLHMPSSSLSRHQKCETNEVVGGRRIANQAIA
ncbi:hypothetical protein V2G26_007064 [Clonostachys chloroleuca]